ncbi:MAG: response regulator, partial [Pyrinomonadaceae bacterium]|nr:response regulator [Pyrinomonadaceae bacterium]
MAKLLIVDDEQGMRQLLTIVFERAGHSVRAAENGRRALELLRAEPAELIISDVKMPDIGGIELLRAARELLPDVAVVMMTAFATVETARE